jgi:hypothetical protein
MKTNLTYFLYSAVKQFQAFVSTRNNGENKRKYRHLR